jgi:hypothetical protein
MKKSILIILVSFRIVCTAFAAAKQDTIYLRCDQDQLKSKFLALPANSHQLMINFTFDVNWKLYDRPHDSVTFTYLGPEKDNQSQWFVDIIPGKQLRELPRVYTLKEFTDGLKGDFLLTTIRKATRLFY